MIIRVAVSWACAWFLWAPSAGAQTPAPVPSFRASAQAQRSGDEPATWIAAQFDGCYDPSEASADPTDPWSLDDFSCVTANLHLTREGRTAAVDQTEFYDPGDGDAAGTAGIFVYWSCRRPGRYDWTVSYTNASVPGFGAGRPYTAERQGNFQVPHCVRPRRRYVDRGTAAARANDVNQSAYPSEFIFSVRCSPSGPVRGGRSTTWTCLTTHNNNYRQCVDRDRFAFIGRDRWGRTVKDYDVSSHGKRCRYF